MAHPNEVLVWESLAAFRRGDMDALRQYWAEDIRFHVPGRSLLAGDYEGIAQFLGVLGRLSELSGGTVRAELRDVLASDEHVVNLYTASAERAGKHWEGNTSMSSVSVTASGPRTGSIQLTSMPTMSSGRNRLTQAIDARRDDNELETPNQLTRGSGGFSVISGY